MSVINFGTNARRDFVSQYTLNVLNEILTKAGCPSALISSTARTPQDQARIMYDNLEAYGAEHQKRLYAAAGDLVIDVYVALRRQHKPTDEIKAAMEAKIIEVGASKISHHCADPRILCVIDIAPSSIYDKAAFELAVHADKRVSKFLLPPADACYHLEIKVPR